MDRTTEEMLTEAALEYLDSQDYLKNMWRQFKIEKEWWMAMGFFVTDPHSIGWIPE